MNTRDFAIQLRTVVRRGLRPGSMTAFAFAILCVVGATLLRLAVGLVAPHAPAFAPYYPFILVATLVGGGAAGAFAMILSAVVSFWAFVPPYFEWSVPTVDQIVNLGLFAIASMMIVWVAAKYRDVLRRLDEEENYRQVVVDELGHRVKNKLATIYAILRHELRGHDDIWKSVSGRLRALSVADDFLVRSDGKGVELRQILEMELEPYGSAKISLLGEPIQLFAKLPTVLALVFHELATNAAKYGSLSAPTGRLTVSWRLGGEHVAVDWVETGGPAVTAPSRRSFGSNLIERSLQGFGGSAKIEFAPAGVVCRITFPRPKPPAAADLPPPVRADMSSAAG